MSRQHNQMTPVRDYLLGKLAEDEALALEDGYFADDRLFLRMQAVEVALIEEYLDQRLTGSDRRAFEARYLPVPALRQKVEAIRERRLAAPIRPSFPARLRPLLAFALLIAIGVGAWLFLQSRSHQPGPIARIETPPVGTVATVRLKRITMGDNGLGNEFALPSAVNELKLVFDIAEPVTGVSVRVWRIAPTGERTPVWTSPEAINSIATSEGPQLAVTLPAAVLRPDDHILEVLTPAGTVRESYFFRVTR